MKSQSEVSHTLICYKTKLAAAVDEKLEFDDALHPEIDIIIFALVNKIETLLWVLDMEIQEQDLLDQIYPVRH
ncbi:MAG: hypothetical protein IJP33_02755 [Firmicutes bacterium]|nr:hypothetical protein [Bacillota bacterium]